MIKASHGVHWHVGKCCEVYLLCMANARLETRQFVCAFAQIVAKPLEFGKSQVIAQPPKAHICGSGAHLPERLESRNALEPEPWLSKARYFPG